MQQLEMLETTDELRCGSCKEVKHKDFFNNKKNRKTGRQCYCKDCQAVQKRKHYLKNAEDYKRKNKLRAQNSQKAKAAGALNYAVRVGKLTKQTCEECGAEKAEAHHDDYAKPLEVRWLCRSHHRQWHVDNGEAPNACTVRHWTPTQELKS